MAGFQVIISGRFWVITEVQRFQATHGGLHVMIMQSEAPRLHLYLMGCDHISGPLGGGWRLRIERDPQGSDLTLRATDGSFFANGTYAYVTDERPTPVLSALFLGKAIAQILDASIRSDSGTHAEVIAAVRRIAEHAASDPPNLEAIVSIFDQLVERDPGYKPARETARLLDTGGL